MAAPFYPQYAYGNQPTQHQYPPGQMGQPANPAAPQPQYQPGQLRAFLLGMGLMPPPRPQDIAVAHFYAAQMDQQHQFGLDPNIDPRLQFVSPPAPVPNRREGQAANRMVPTLQGVAKGAIYQVLKESVECGRCKQRNSVTTHIVLFKTDLSPEDFLSRLCAHMDIPRARACLGYKLPGEPKRDPWHTLNTDADVGRAIGDVVEKQCQAIKNKVVLEISNMAYNPKDKNGKKDKEPVLTEMGYMAELRLVKEKLCCKTHSIVRNHIVGKDDLPDTCNVMPNMLNFENLKANTQRVLTCKRKQSRCGSTLPPIHIHIESPLRDIQNNTPSSSRKRCRSNESGDDSSLELKSDDDDTPTPIPIQEVLATLHETLPLVNYPEYADALIKQGVIYARSVTHFKSKFYVEKVGMPEGIVKDFRCKVKKMVNKAGKGDHRAKYARCEDVSVVAGDENINPT
ncbi:hypothetical protein JAAARDRAFT_48481 [Jaapia argillacea MUCL 33604]|uniref:Uncharacterized protein n=1 Tax=Jaapia argillacea MUCL 33604 TaxID=933084 RepID=A0A067PMZ8_9AGAM|nr:hypothetical protein JAAARDRAFT_48481 [Jaapia argillacea MUCL 33604]